MTDATPQELAQGAMTKGTFRFSDVLKGKGYPEDDVEIWFDDKAAYPLVDLTAKLQAAVEKLSGISEKSAVAYKAAKKELEALDKQRLTLVADLKKQTYVFRVKGISPGDREDLLNQANADYPLEYDEYTNPITGQKTKTPVDDPDRNRLYTNLLWLARLVSITAPDGSVQTDFTIEDAAQFRRGLPLVASQKIQAAMEKVDMSVDWFEALTDEAFLVTP